jgi:hypothetical protein
MFVAAISLCRLLLDPTSVGVEFVVDKVALVQFFPLVHLFLTVSIIPKMLHNHLQQSVAVTRRTSGRSLGSTKQSNALSKGSKGSMVALCVLNATVVLTRRFVVR